jgi:hypothetical protein
VSVTSYRLELSNVFHIRVGIFKQWGDDILIFTSSLEETNGQSSISGIVVDHSVVNVPGFGDLIVFLNLLRSHVTQFLVVSHGLSPNLRKETRAQELCSWPTVGVELPKVALDVAQHLKSMSEVSERFSWNHFDHPVPKLFCHLKLDVRILLESINVVHATVVDSPVLIVLVESVNFQLVAPLGVFLNRSFGLAKLLVKLDELPNGDFLHLLLVWLGVTVLDCGVVELESHGKIVWMFI